MDALNLESLHIAAADKRKILNKSNELVTQCRITPKSFSNHSPLYTHIHPYIYNLLFYVLFLIASMFV